MPAAPDAAGLSGHAVRGMVENQPESVANAALGGVEETVRQAAGFAMQAIDHAGKALGGAVDMASDKAFQAAANVGANIASPPAQQAAQAAFSWSGYVQALGVMCLLLAGLWFAVWGIRRYGKFNFLPRPGSLPRDSLVMETQMPLGPRKGLMVVRFMKHRLLLGVTESRISLLVEEKLEDAGGQSNFAAYLDNAHSDSGSAGLHSH